MPSPKRIRTWRVVCARPPVFARCNDGPITFKQLGHEVIVVDRHADPPAAKARGRAEPSESAIAMQRTGAIFRPRAGARPGWMDPALCAKVRRRPLRQVCSNSAIGEPAKRRPARTDGASPPPTAARAYGHSATRAGVAQRGRAPNGPHALLYRRPSFPGAHGPRNPLVRTRLREERLLSGGKEAHGSRARPCHTIGNKLAGATFSLGRDPARDPAQFAARHSSFCAAPPACAS